MRDFCGNAKVNDVINCAWIQLFTGKYPWFKNEDEADDWAGDVAFEFLFEVLERLGIDCDGEEEEE